MIPYVMNKEGKIERFNEIWLECQPGQKEAAYLLPGNIYFLPGDYENKWGMDWI